MKTMRVPLLPPGQYSEVRVYGRYGGIAVTEHPFGDRYSITHLLSGQRVSDVTFAKLSVARACARELSSVVDWTLVDQWSKPLLANPWNEGARKTAGDDRKLIALGRKVQRIITRHQKAAVRS